MDLSDLTLETLVQSWITIAVVIIVTILGSRLVCLVLRRLIRRTETEFDDQLLETIRPQIIWLLAAIGSYRRRYRRCDWWDNLAILVVNAFPIGLVIAVATRREPLIREQAKPIWAAGIAGGLTTFSSLAWETVSMLPKPT